MSASSVKNVTASSEENALLRRFQLRQRQTNVKTECLAGITGFLAAAYLLVVIPGLLAVSGMDKGAATTGVILVFVLGSLLMAFYANLPFMVGPGIGGSVLVGITLAGDGISWPIALGIACWSGILFFVMTVFGLREVVTRSVPQSIKLGLTASIGIFVALLGFRNAGLVMANAKTHALALGDFTAPGALIALLGLLVAVGLQARKVPGAILWAILLATVAGIPFGVTHLPAQWISLPHSVAPLLGKVDLTGAMNIAFLPFLFIFFASEFFSTMGTTLAVGGEAGLLDEHGNMKHINRPFMVDSIAAALGPVVGIPAATALIESSAAAEAGGKTGLTALAAAVMFLLMLLFTPVALMIPKEATAPALILIGLNMFSNLRKVDLANFTDALPVLMMVMITLISNSFGTGIAGGLLFYVVIKAVAGKAREVPVGLYILAIPLVYYFATLVHH
ncbi:AGZA family xanthine/uracil permease-like MFS transporter [Rahnella sp. BIGb0236]|uniref:NCS2 family permease n=1 Tax=Rahnella sp. BIGb0236 TaxID=2485117 RepID=UPI001060D57B|nr:NCS2 family permease [Rahnella sp. BIGb0236]TDS97017.1 AGZA family xanthine/uracil permease-like MFS transporter [Rahnella sp. BIGb0236]